MDNRLKNVSRAGCGSTHLCTSEPSGCDPSQAGSCFFLSAKQTSGRNFEFGLSGESTGFLSASLSLDATAGGNDTTYVCANNNGKVQFFSAVLNNGQLTQRKTSVSRADCGSIQLCPAEPSGCDPSQAGSCFFLAAKQTSGRNFEFGLSGESTGFLSACLSLDVTALEVNSVKGRVDGNKIQCTFAATVPAQLTRAQGFSVSISTGPFNATSGELGSPTVAIRTPVVNLANPNATVKNELATNTTGPNTTAAATTGAHTT
eukprot:superscaffoldBa00005970_g20992